MSTALSGVNGNVFSGAVDLDVEGWTADMEIIAFDSTTTADLGWEDETAATKKVQGSFDFFYNLSKKPTGGSANLTPGNIVTLTLQVTTGEQIIGVALIKKLSLKSKVRNGFMVTASFTSKGVWTMPS